MRKRTSYTMWWKRMTMLTLWPSVGKQQVSISLLAVRQERAAVHLQVQKSTVATWFEGSWTSLL